MSWATTSNILDRFESGLVKLHHVISYLQSQQRNLFNIHTCRVWLYLFWSLARSMGLKLHLHQARRKGEQVRVKSGDLCPTGSLTFTAPPLPGGRWMGQLYTDPVQQPIQAQINSFWTTTKGIVMTFGLSPVWNPEEVPIEARCQPNVGQNSKMWVQHDIPYQRKKTPPMQMVGIKTAWYIWDSNQKA